jgi:hypothetical protein
MVLAVLAVIVLLGIFLIAMYNSLVQLRVRSESAWSDIDVQLKRRHDLIPNLVETVKGYATHEKARSKTSPNSAPWPCRPPARSTRLPPKIN